MSADALDGALVRRHLDVLDQALTHLRHFVGRPESDLRRDLDARWAVERGLQICTQTALELATHLAAALGPAPADYPAAIVRLGESRVLPPEFAARFQGVVDLHDVLAHSHLEYDLKFLYAMLNGRLDELARFGAHVEAWLARGAGR